MGSRRTMVTVALVAVVAAASVGACSAGRSVTDTAKKARTAGESTTSSPPTSVAPPASDVGLTLAAPTGPSPTGTSLIHLVEPTEDPLNPGSGKRQLMVQLWYPTTTSATQPFAPYAPPKEVAALQKFYPVPAGAFDVQTHSRMDAPVSDGPHPVIFFYPGLVGARTDSTAVAEQLASLGYVVVATADTDESSGVQFPDGTLVGMTNPAFAAAGGAPFTAKNSAVLNQLLSVRVSDVRYIADQLERINKGINPDADGKTLPAGLRGTMTLTGMGMYGHSFGGGTAATVVATDARFAAGIDLDGFVLGPVGQRGTSKPFLMVGTSDHDGKLDPTWGTFIPKLTGWHRWFAVTNAGHYRFIDLGGSATKWGLAKQIKPKDPTTWKQIFGDINDAQSQKIDRALVAGFFGHQLRAMAEPVLDNPTATFPQVLNRTGRNP